MFSQLISEGWHWSLLVSIEVGQSMQGMGGPVQVSMPLCSTVSEKEEVESKPLVGVISPPVVPVESHNPEPVPMPIHMPLVNGTRPNDSYTVPDTRLDYDTDIIGDDLDELLDRASPPESSLVSLRRPHFCFCFECVQDMLMFVFVFFFHPGYSHNGWTYSFTDQYCRQ